MALDFGKIIFFVGILLAAVGPVATNYVRTKDSAVWLNPLRLLKSYGKYEVFVHLIGLALVLAGVYLVYQTQ